MKNDIEALRLGKFYIIADKNKLRADEYVGKPDSLRIFETRYEGHPPQEICISGSSSLAKLQKFINDLYEDEEDRDHEYECEDPNFKCGDAVKFLLGDIIKIFSGLDMNRIDGSIVELSTKGPLFGEICRANAAIVEILKLKDLD